ncbi:MAG: hypothetical protein RIC14_05015 [Filomicrobium sp.]
MSNVFSKIKSYLAIALLAVGSAMAMTTLTATLAPNQAEAGVLKKAKKGSKLIGKGAGWVERKLARKGKVGKFVSKGFGGIRKGANKASKGVGKVQKGTRKAFNKVCRGSCRKVAKGVKKVGKGWKHLKRQAERKCRQFGRDSRACRIAMDAVDFASPI